MKIDEMFDVLGDVSDVYVESAKVHVTRGKRTTLRVWGTMAACLALLMAVGIPSLINLQNKINLSVSSVGVRVKYTDNVPIVNSSASLIYLTEEELFSYFDTAIFKGTVVSIENIELDFNGDKDYRAIAAILVEEVYRGDIEENDIVSVLLPCPISSNVFMTDSKVISTMRVGTIGIYMPNIYDDTSIWGQNGATLVLKDIADYGFADGMRYAFLETGNGIFFDSHSYESISNAVTLEQVKQYIENMIS